MTIWWTNIYVSWRHFNEGYKVSYLGILKRDSKNANVFVTEIDVDELPLLKGNIVRIVCISDTHNRHSWLTKHIPNGTILIHCGDITMQGMGGTRTVNNFVKWFQGFNHRYKIIMGGNHDRFMPNMMQSELENLFQNIIYLDNNGIVLKELDDLKIFGSPWSPFGYGSKNHAFQSITNDDVHSLNQYLNQNNNIDILIGHSDLSTTIMNKHHKEFDQLLRKSNACIHICGHFHARYGIKYKYQYYTNKNDMLVVNCSSLDGLYIPKQYPIVFDLMLE